MKQPVLLSINTAWNFVNFRMGLLQRLVAEGFDVVTAAPPDDQVGRLRDVGVRFVPIEIDRKSLSPVRDLALLFNYRRILLEVSPVAYLSWTIKPNIWGSIAAIERGIPVINNISGLGTAFMKPGALQLIVQRLYKLALRKSSTIFFQNAADRELFIGLGIASEGQTALLPGSGIDVMAFRPARRPVQSADTPLTFLMIARLLGDKGVREFVQAARAMGRAGYRARFQIMGAEDRENRSAIGAHELEDWLTEGVIEHLPHRDDVRTAIADADCIVLPSYREGTPRSLLEGAAMAKPLIASDVPGCTRIARQGENAFLCRAKDAASLADAMQQMVVLPPSERNRMGLVGRRIAEEEFDEAIVIDRYMEALQYAIVQT